MKKIIALLSLISLNAFADEFYKCYNVQQGRSEDVTMKITTSFLSGKIKAVNLVSEIKGTNFTATINPFTTVDASFMELDEEAVKEASQLKFKEFKKSPASQTKMALSESLLKFQKVGFAHYYSYSCFWVLPCHTTSQYFKCDKI